MWQTVLRFLWPLVADALKFIFRCVVCNTEKIIEAESNKAAVKVMQAAGWRGPRKTEAPGWRCPCSP